MSDKVVNKKTFEVEVEGKPTKFAVVRPTHKVSQAAQMAYNRAFREAVSPADGSKGLLVRQKVESVMREQRLWDDQKQARYDELKALLLTNELKLAGGGIKLSKAREMALEMRKARHQLRELLAERNELDAATAESFAEQARFNHYVAACTVYGDSGKPYYQDVDDYLSRQEDPVAGPAAHNFGLLYYGLEDNYESKLPENAFLAKYKLVDEKLRLINKDGKLVDEKGRLVNEQGRLVNEKNELVDADGNLLTEDGDYKVEFKEFEDDVFEPAGEADKAPEAPVAA